MDQDIGFAKVVFIDKKTFHSTSQNFTKLENVTALIACCVFNQFILQRYDS